MNYKLIIFVCLFVLGGAHADPINIVPAGASVILVSSEEVLKMRLDEDRVADQATDVGSFLCHYVFEKGLVRWKPAMLPEAEMTSVDTTPRTYQASVLNYGRDGVSLKNVTQRLEVFQPERPSTPLAWLEVYGYLLSASFELSALPAHLASLYLSPGSDILGLKEERDMFQSSAFHILPLGILTSLIRWYSSDYPDRPPARYALPVLVSELWCE